MSTKVPRRRVDQLHERADVGRRRDDRELDPRLRDRLDLAGIRAESAGLSTATVPLPSIRLTWYSTDGADAIRSRSNSRSSRSWTISMWSRPRKPQRKPKPSAHRALGLVGEAASLRWSLLERVAQERVVVAVERVDARRRPASWPACSRAAARSPGRSRRSSCRRPGSRGRSSGPSRHSPPRRRSSACDGHELRPEDAQLEDVRSRRPTPSAGSCSCAWSVPVDEPDVGDDALVRVVVRVEDQALERRVRIALRRRDAVDDGLEDLVDAGAFLGRGEDDLLARDGRARSRALR